MNASFRIVFAACIITIQLVRYRPQESRASSDMSKDESAVPCSSLCHQKVSKKVQIPVHRLAEKGQVFCRHQQLKQVSEYVLTQWCEFTLAEK
jgi:hypothetical protein